MEGESGGGGSGENITNKINDNAIYVTLTIKVAREFYGFTLWMDQNRIRINGANAAMEYNQQWNTLIYRFRVGVSFFLTTFLCKESY